MTRSKATKSKSSGREGWCAIFYHPGRLDEDGKPVRVRRGLGTRDEAEANLLVAQLNELILAPEWHTPAAKERALAKVDKRVVAIFFDSMEPETQDGWTLRGEVLALPGVKDGYPKVLLCGSTGAGKTTFLRQLIGTDPDQERFPSTSTAKTTVADIELILMPGPFRAVVSFFGREKIRGYIEECVVAAAAAAAEGESDREVGSNLLEHHEQRFRLSYLLGTIVEPEPSDEDWDAQLNIEATEAEVSDDERRELASSIASFVDRCKKVGYEAREALAKSISVDAAKLIGTDRDAFLVLLEEQLLTRDDTMSLIDDILDEVEGRFTLLDGAGTLDRSRSGWPTRWSWDCQDRGEFLRRVNRLSSNYAPNFGKLLTPVVQGIRVQGPFVPSWNGDTPPQLVILDGEGLGHTSDSSQSLPMQLTRRFSEVDVIALVDSATQPMLAGPAAVLRAATATGHDSKLVVVFTHFDEVKGANLLSTAAKQDHVRHSLGNVLSGLESALDSSTVRGLKRNLDGRILFFAAIDQRLDRLAVAPMRRFTEASLKSFLQLCMKSIEPLAPVEAHPVYDTSNLVLAVAGATARFQLAWGARLGMDIRPGIRPEHWTRIKALSRRFAEWNEDCYDDMLPVADFFRELAVGLSNFVSTPFAWQPTNAPEELQQQALEAIRRSVSSRLQDLATSRLQTDPLVSWRHAYRLAGTGSGKQRARDIWGIYTDAAPRLSEVPTPEGISFVDAVRALFADAVQEAGGKIR